PEVLDGGAPRDGPDGLPDALHELVRFLDGGETDLHGDEHGLTHGRRSYPVATPAPAGRLQARSRTGSRAPPGAPGSRRTAGSGASRCSRRTPSAPRRA